MLTWAPPIGWEQYTVYTISQAEAEDTSVSVLRLTLNDSTDYQIKCDHIVRRAVEIRGGRNVVWFGGHIRIDYKGPFASAGSRRAMMIRYGNTNPVDRIVHLEGHRWDGDDLTEGINSSAPEARIRLQQTFCDTVFFRSCDDRDATNGIIPPASHPDLIQPWGGCKELFVDGFTGYTTYQGLMLNVDPAATSQLPEATRIKRMNMRAGVHTAVEEGPATFEPGEFVPAVVKYGFTNSIEGWIVQGSGSSLSWNQDMIITYSGSANAIAAEPFRSVVQDWSVDGDVIGVSVRLLSGADNRQAWLEIFDGVTWNPGPSTPLTLSESRYVLWEPGDLLKTVQRLRLAISFNGSGSAAVSSVGVGSASEGQWTYNGPVVNYSHNRCLTLDTNYSTLFIDPGTVWAEHSPNGGWVDGGNTSSSRKATAQGSSSNSGFYWTRRYDPGHVESVDGYVYDPPPGTSQPHNFFFPAPTTSSDAQGTFLTWTEPRLRNWDNTGQAKIYSGVLPGGDYVNPDAVGLAYSQTFERAVTLRFTNRTGKLV